METTASKYKDRNRLGKLSKQEIAEVKDRWDTYPGSPEAATSWQQVKDKLQKRHNRMSNLANG